MSNEPNTAIAPAEPSNPTVIVGKQIRNMIEKQTLHLPTDYSAENALKSAWLKLSATDISKCSKESVVNALMSMVIQGLNVDKNQCYLIPYGNQLQCQRSYFGDQALALRLNPGIEFYDGVVYEGDEFTIEIIRGKKFIVKHVTDLLNQDKGIKGAYCGYVNQHGEDMGAVIMTMAEIKQSWQQSKSMNNTSPHAKFPAEMAKRTVIRKRCKNLINSSSDVILMEAIRASDNDIVDAEMAAEIALEANAGPVVEIAPAAPVEAPAPVIEVPEEAPKETVHAGF